MIKTIYVPNWYGGENPKIINEVPAAKEKMNKEKEVHVTFYRHQSR
jgi:hypothetical protein